MTSIWQMVRGDRCRKCPAPCGIAVSERNRPEAVCPLGQWPTLAPGLQGGIQMPLPVPSSLASNPPEAWGPAMWASLHRWALTTAAPAAERGKWLEQFSRRLPICECRSHWRQYLRDVPPPLEGDAVALFAWSVGAHNAVRRRKEQPEMDLEVARALWLARLAGALASEGPAD
jgi:hypothetical protein